ncbi:MAG: glycosyltransferase family 4 protein [FCB group bacterium]|nr:glycosyltransferase family 4 protein [FCB group bacterium]
MTRPENQKSLLFVSIDFPPARTSGIYRPVYWTKYMIEAGWDITLLTAARHLSTVEDNSLADMIDPRLKVIRATAPMPLNITGRVYDQYKKTTATAGAATQSSLKARIFKSLKRFILSPLFRLIENFVIIPDNYIIWSLKNLPKAYRLIKKNNISHLLVTSPPQSVQVMGLLLSYLTDVHYITDFRNSWTDNQPYRNRLREKMEKFLERKVLQRSRAVINMSPGDIDRLLERMPDYPREKLSVITNGYNESDFVDYAGPHRTDPTEPLTLVYVGSMYPHSGDSTAKALKILVEKGYDRNDLRLSIIGFSDASFDQLIREYGAEHLVDNQGFVDHDKLVRSYHLYDIMYLTTGGTPFYHKGALPGKIFEYMRMEKPILHVGIEGTTHQMLIKSGLETFVPLDDPTGIAQAIIDLIERKKSSSLNVTPDRDYARSFEWRELAAKADQIISGVR